MFIKSEQENSGNELQTLIVLMKHWRHYNTIADGKSFFTEGEVNDELKSFNERVLALTKVIEVLLTFIKDNVEKYDTQITLLSSQLVRLSVIQKQSALNSGGRFEWVDSVVVKAISKGHIVRLENVNLASSAILDRLNPIFESNGKMLLSEKGVGKDNKPEIIKKNTEFRIFLTLDPKHGEISRAMRNRCIELAIPKETYTEDDLRKLVYREGVHEMYLIKAILRIHHALKEVTEYNSFGVAHVIKFAFLVSQNKSMGVEDEKSLLVSALEVYVRSSNIDLLGFGLSFYQDKLKSVVLEGIEELKRVQKSPNVINYENVILKANQLTTINLIKLQAEPFVAVLNCIIDPQLDLKSVLTDLSTKFEDIEILDQESVAKFLMYMLYEMSTISDFHQRASYIHEMLQGHKEFLHLVLLNAEFLKDMKFCGFLNMTDDVKELPWNTRMFPRIAFNYESVPREEQYKTSLILLLRISLDKIIVTPTTKRSELTALTYSNVVMKKFCTDSLDNPLITNLYGFLRSYEKFIEDTLKFTAHIQIGYSEYVDLTVSFLWFNRLLKSSQQKLFLNKVADEEVLVDIMLHFKWMDKNCFASLPMYSTNNFLKLHKDRINLFISQNNHPLEMISKQYSKNFNGYLPFNKQQEISWYNTAKTWNDLVSIVPKLKTAYDFEKYQTRLQIMTSQLYQEHKNFLVNQVKSFSKEIFSKFTFNESVKNDFQDVVDRYQEITNKEEDLDHDFLRLSLESKMYDIGELSKSFPIIEESMFNLEMIPIYEYLLFKILYAQLNSNNKNIVANVEYCTEIKSLNLEVNKFKNSVK